MMNRIAIYLLALGAFGIGTAEFVVSGILEIISSDLNVSIAMAGQLITVYAFSHALGALFLVLLTAKFERKKVLLYSMFVFMTGSIIAFFSFHYGMLMTSRIILAGSGGLYFVVATNYAAQLAPAEKRGSAIATIITGFTVSLVLGVPIGTFISAYMDWRYIFLFLAIVTFINIMLLNKFIPKLEGNKPLSLKQQLRLMKDKKIITGLCTTVFSILGYTMLFAYIAPLLSTLANFSIEEISTALFTLGIFAFIGSRTGGYAVDKWGPVRTIVISLVSHAVVLFSLTVTAVSTIGVFLFLIIWGVAAWTTTPANQYYLISLKPQSAEIVLSFNTALMNIGMTIGAGLGGIVIQYTSILNLGWVSGLMVCIALGTAWISFTLNRKNSEHYVSVEQ